MNTFTIREQPSSKRALQLEIPEQISPSTMTKKTAVTAAMTPSPKKKKERPKPKSLRSQIPKHIVLGSSSFSLLSGDEDDAVPKKASSRRQNKSKKHPKRSKDGLNVLGSSSFSLLSDDEEDTVPNKASSSRQKKSKKHPKRSKDGHNPRKNKSKSKTQASKAPKEDGHDRKKKKETKKVRRRNRTSTRKKLDTTETDGSTKIENFVQVQEFFSSLSDSEDDDLSFLIPKRPVSDRQWFPTKDTIDLDATNDTTLTVDRAKYSIRRNMPSLANRFQSLLSGNQ